MKKIIAAIIATAIAAAAFSGCNGSNKVENEVVPFPVTVNNTTIEKAPKAVASLSPVLTKILIDLGYLTKIAGYSDGDKLPAPPPPPPVSSEPEKFRWFWEKKPEPVKAPDPVIPKGEIGTALVPNFENIGKYLPEIIFTTIPVTKEQLSKLDAVNIKLIVIPSAQNIHELQNNYIAVMKAMAGQVEVNEKGLAQINEMNDKISYISSVVKTKQTYLYLCSIDPIIATGDTYESSLLSTVATNAAGEFKNYTVTPEELAALDPDIIIYSDDIPKENIVSNELFKDKKAVAEDKLIPLNRSVFTNQTPAVTEEIRKIGKLIYPQIDFTQPAPVSSDVSSGKSKKK